MAQVGIRHCRVHGIEMEITCTSTGSRAFTDVSHVAKPQLRKSQTAPFLAFLTSTSILDPSRVGCLLSDRRQDSCGSPGLTVPLPPGSTKPLTTVARNKPWYDRAVQASHAAFVECPLTNRLPCGPPDGLHDAASVTAPPVAPPNPSTLVSVPAQVSDHICAS